MATLSQTVHELTARQRGRVLVIDDDPAIRELLSLHLANRGYDVAVVFLTSEPIMADRLLDVVARAI